MTGERPTPAELAAMSPEQIEELLEAASAEAARKQAERWERMSESERAAERRAVATRGTKRWAN